MSSNTYQRGVDPGGAFSPIKPLGFFGPIAGKVFRALALGVGIAAGLAYYDLWGPK